jgi:transporter family protein
MHVPPWFWFALVTLLCWGGAGLLQKLSTNHISAESSLIWLVVGFLLLEPFFYPGKSIFTYSSVNLAWALFAALKSGGKASIVAPVTALYPLVVIALVPFVLKESITPLQVAGITCSLIAIVLLSA